MAGQAIATMVRPYEAVPRSLRETRKRLWWHSRGRTPQEEHGMREWSDGLPRRTTASI